ncbi:2561_t:CDS:10, partial [Acaulospora morrowiae]
ATISEYLKIVEGLLEFPDNIADFHPESHLQLLNELYFVTLSCHGLCSVCKLDEKVKEIIETWEVNLGRTLFGNAEKLLMEEFINFSTRQQKAKMSSLNQFKDIRAFMINAVTRLRDYLTNDCLRIIKECVKTEVPMIQNSIEDFLTMFQAQLRNFWHSLVKSMTKFVSPKIPQPQDQQISQPPAIVVLVMSRILLDFGEIVVSQVYTSYSDRLYPQRDSNVTIGMNVYDGYNQRNLIAKEFAQDVREIVGLCKDVAQRTLERYVEIVGNKLSSDIRYLYSSYTSMSLSSNGVDDSISKTQPSKVSEIWLKTISELTYVEKEAIMLYESHDEEEDESINENSTMQQNKGDAQSMYLDPSSAIRPTGEPSPNVTSGNNTLLKPPYSHSNSSYSSVNSGRAKTSPNPFASQVHLMSHIDKLFSDRIEVYGIVDFTKFGIVMGVVKILLKTWIETIRMQTLTNQEFQQIQIDSEYMRIKLWKFVEDERLGIMNTMLQELASSAFRRCAEEPLPLENSIIEKIVNGS